MYAVITRWDNKGRVNKAIDGIATLDDANLQLVGLLERFPQAFVVEAPNAPTSHWIADPSAKSVSVSPPAPTRDDVNRERNRRIGAGFSYDFGPPFGLVRFQTDQKSRDNIRDAMALSQVAIGAGALEGDLRWSDPNRDFTWIAANNTQVTMDAQTCLAFCMAAMAYKEAIIIAARNLKDFPTIPQDYASDVHWP